METGILDSSDWSAASQLGTIPIDIPTNPSVVYRGKGWKGWPAFLGRAVRGGSSIVEDVIAHELSQFAVVDQHVRSIALGGGARKRVDIVLSDLALIIEYDGAYWHSKTVDKDKRDNEALAAAGWKVLRIREIPLQTLSDHDVVVDAGWPLIRKTSLLLRRLHANGMLPNVSTGAIDKYESAGRLYAASTELARVVGWRSYADAKNWVQAKGVDSESAWRKLRRSGTLPRDIPSTPEAVYAVEWQGWGEFLGTGRTAARAEFVHYDTAKDWASRSGIRQAREWIRASKAGLLPPEVPGAPDSVYAELWEGWGIFLGVSDDPKRRRSWLPFDEARVWARELAKTKGVDSEVLWRRFRKSETLPANIPRSPQYVYRDQWVSWGDFFGTGNGVGGAARWRKERARNANSEQPILKNERAAESKSKRSGP